MIEPEHRVGDGSKILELFDKVISYKHSNNIKI
ncbi:hypothetical protein SAMN04488692_105125 [Halarsenatibacter silvermanii]|uniref:Uncharacterized protein n=1 Tax=Halarsenatibacter silvermanii TaxID=321763 RepID=A0A1G9KY59_9FIRM|nr:hypothetical protein SAMN04488692_105125 [Halarsenatibacter silvermanii]